MKILKSAIYAAGYNQKSFAYECGISSVWLTQIIKNKGRASKKLAQRIENLLDGEIKSEQLLRNPVCCPFCSKQMTVKSYNHKIEELSK